VYENKERRGFYYGQLHHLAAGATAGKLSLQTRMRFRLDAHKAIPDRPPFGILVPEMGLGLLQFSAVISGDSLQGLPRVGLFGETFRCPMESGVT
jgi:hypothetical protein